MKLTRRRLATRSALAAALAGTAGCVGNLASRGPRVTFSGNVHSEEPLVEDVDISVEDRYPNHYSRIVTSKDAESEEIRWGYIEREHGGLVDDLEGTDFDSEFLMFFGLVLPRTKQLQPGSTRIEDDTLHVEYSVAPASSGNSEVVLNTAMMRVIHDDPPSDVSVSVTYP